MRFVGCMDPEPQINLWLCMDLFPAVWPQTNYFRFPLPVFKTASRISEAKLTCISRRNESTERTKLVRQTVELN